MQTFTILQKLTSALPNKAVPTRRKKILYMPLMSYTSDIRITLMLISAQMQNTTLNLQKHKTAHTDNVKFIYVLNYNYQTI